MLNRVLHHGLTNAGVGIALLATACAPTLYVRPGATHADDVRVAYACRYEALTTPPPYQSGLPVYSFDPPYSHYKTAGVGLLTVLLLDRISTAAWRDQVNTRCLLAEGYRPL